MTLSSEQQRNLTLSSEGNSLAQTSQFGAETAAEIIRCQITGMMNALLRIGGPERTADFAFRVADRLCGNIKIEADFILPAPEKPVDQAPEPKRQPKLWWLAPFSFGFLYGATWIAWAIWIWSTKL